MFKASLLALVLLCSLSCSTASDPAADRANFTRNVQSTIDTYLFKVPQLKRFFDESYGWAVFPSAGKGGLFVGAGFGRAQVFQRGNAKPLGEATITQVSVGLQFGGQAFSEIIFFRQKRDFEVFIAGKFSFAANASAVAIETGISTNLDYTKDVAVFTMAKGGLMVEATVGGQNFSFSWYMP